MSRKLNEIFDVKSRKAQRAILDKFDITASDKNEVLNKIASNGGGGDNVQAKFYKINKEYCSDNIGFITFFANLMGIADMTNEDGIKSYSITPSGMLLMYGNSMLENLHTMSFMPIKIRTMDTNQQFGDYTFVNTIYDVGNDLGFSKEDIDKAFIEITEEEFYNFNPNKL